MNAKDKEAKKNTKKMLKYQSMPDHDILVEMVVIVGYIKESITTMNGAIKRQARRAEAHEIRIGRVETTCTERSKTVFSRLDATDDRFSGSFRISKKVIGVAIGSIGAIITTVYLVGKFFRWWG